MLGNDGFVFNKGCARMLQTPPNLVNVMGVENLKQYILFLLYTFLFIYLFNYTIPKCTLELSF